MKPVPNQLPSTDPGPVRLALVGESPGPTEEAEGRPFVGNSGRVLNDWLETAGISRAQCFIGNVAQVRPAAVRGSGSVAPNEFHLFEWHGSEIQEGIAALREDLACFRPHIVVALGNAALHLLRHGNVAPPKSAKLRLFQWTSHVGVWRGSLFLGASDFDPLHASDLRFREGRCPPQILSSPSPAGSNLPCAKSSGSSVNQMAAAQAVIDGDRSVAVEQPVTAGKDRHTFNDPPAAQRGPSTPGASDSATSGAAHCAASGESQSASTEGSPRSLGARLAEADAHVLVPVDRGNVVEGRSLDVPVSNPAPGAAFSQRDATIPGHKTPGASDARVTTRKECLLDTVQPALAVIPLPAAPVLAEPHQHVERLDGEARESTRTQSLDRISRCQGRESERGTLAAAGASLGAHDVAAGERESANRLGVSPMPTGTPFADGACCQPDSVPQRMGRIVECEQAKPSSPLLAPFATFKCLATYHPAATFREPSFTFPLVSDLKRAVAEARSASLTLPERHIVWGLPIDELEGRCAAIRNRREPVGFDIEGGLGGLQCASFATSPADAFVIDLMGECLERPRTLAAIASVLEDAAVPKVLWNAAYERAIMQVTSSITLRNYEDPMLAWWERWSELPKGLDFVASILTREPYWAEGIGWDRKTGAPKITGPPFWTYCAVDSMTTLEIWQSPLIRAVAESRTPVAFASL